MAQGNTLYHKVFQSSHIHSATYDPAAHSLEIVFTNGRRYTNDPDMPVPVDVWNAFMVSGSPGIFFDTEIKQYWGGLEMGVAGQGQGRGQGPVQGKGQF